MKYLGVIFDQELRFKSHLQYIIKNGTDAALVLARIAKAGWSVVYGRSLIDLWPDSAMGFPGFVYVVMFWDRFWARFGHVLANVGDTGIWLEHGKSMVKSRHWQGWLFATFPVVYKKGR